MHERDVTAAGAVGCGDPDCDPCRAAREYGVSAIRCINAGRRVGPSEEGCVSNERLLEVMRADHEAVFGDGACPDWARDSINRYMSEGLPTGDFLRAVLANDLMAAFARADVATAKTMAGIVGYVHRHVPHGICGSYEIVDQYARWCAEQRAKVAAAKARAESSTGCCATCGDRIASDGTCQHVRKLLGKAEA